MPAQGRSRLAAPKFSNRVTNCGVRGSTSVENTHAMNELRPRATRPRGDTSVRIESLSHLADSTVDQQLSDLVATDRGTTARMLHQFIELLR